MTVTPFLQSEIVRLHRAGSKAPGIAARIGMNVHTVRWWIKRLDACRKPVPTARDWAQWLVRRGAGL